VGGDWENRSLFQSILAIRDSECCMRIMGSHQRNNQDLRFDLSTRSDPNISQEERNRMHNLCVHSLRGWQ
jgi:hypothetical protein